MNNAKKPPLNPKIFQKIQHISYTRHFLGIFCNVWKGLGWENREEGAGVVGLIVGGLVWVRCGGLVLSCLVMFCLILCCWAGERDRDIEQSGEAGGRGAGRGAGAGKSGRGSSGGGQAALRRQLWRRMPICSCKPSPHVRCPASLSRPRCCLLTRASSWSSSPFSVTQKLTSVVWAATSGL